jgi:peptide/nickel transport system ATP-binding protein
MYRGQTVEEGLVAEVLSPPYHPYTEALLSAVPVVGAQGRDANRMRLVGDPGGGAIGPGCRFTARCPHKLGAICDTVPPPWQQATPQHRIACHIPLAQLAMAKPVLAPG